MKLYISAKCRDMCFLSVSDDHQTIHDEDGYVPQGIHIGGGDYVDFTIDTETGKIVGWSKEDFDTWLQEKSSK